MMPMPGGGYPVGGGILAMDDRGGTHLLGVIEGTVPVQGIRGRDGGRIFGGAQDDTVGASGRGKT